MSLYSLRFRRALSISSSLINGTKPFSSIISSPSPFSSTIIPNPSFHLTENSRFLTPFQCRSFRSSTITLSSRPRSPAYDRGNNDDKIGPDEILFEGCDFNHWLITMDFPKDPKPSPEEMVETYVQTAAKVLGSVEEAKKKIYACSTTTYQGFQVEVTEEMSEKFRGLPGVVFILPDSYLDTVNKEYGGDKYENGVITHRPPPVQYGRQGRTRGPYQQGNSGYQNQGPNRNFGAQQNPQSQQNYGPPPGANVRRDNIPISNNNNNGPIGQKSYAPPQGGNFGQGSYQGSGRPAGQTGGTQGQGGVGGFRQGSGWSSGQTGGTQGQGGVGGYGQTGGTQEQGGYGHWSSGQTGGTQGQGGVGGYGQTGGTQGQGGVGGYGQGAGQPSGQGGVGGFGQGSGWSSGQTGGTQGQGGVGGYGQGSGWSSGQTGGTQGQGGVGGYGQTGGTQGQGGYGQGSYGQTGGTYGQGSGGGYGQGGYNSGQGNFGQRGQRESG